MTNANINLANDATLIWWRAIHYIDYDADTWTFLFLMLRSIIHVVFQDDEKINFDVLRLELMDFVYLEIWSLKPNLSKNRSKQCLSSSSLLKDDYCPLFSSETFVMPKCFVNNIFHVMKFMIIFTRKEKHFDMGNDRSFA